MTSRLTVCTPLTMLLMAAMLAMPSANAGETNFSLCGLKCGTAKYYVGYNRTNAAKIDAKTSAFPQQNDLVYHHVADLKKGMMFDGLNEEKVDLENGTFASSIHRIDALQIGFNRKSEFMNVMAKSSGETIASIRMIWGDTLTVISQTLPVGTPVTLQIQRKMDGFGSPVTDFAHYNAKSQTFLNQKPLPELDYTLDKQPGVGQTEKMVGKAQSTATIATRVGDILTLESLLVVQDGVNSSSTLQTLNGADSVQHQIQVLTPEAQVRSESGVFNAFGKR